MRITRNLFFVLFLIGVRPASAIMITLDAPDTVRRGNDFEVSVNVTGLQAAGNPLIGAFDFTFELDNTLAQFLQMDSSFGGSLGDYSVGESVQGVSTSTVSASTLINVFEVSLLSSAELLALQGQDSFTLYTFALNALDIPGPSAFVLDVQLFDIVLSDDFGNSLLNQSMGPSASITLVPEPSTLALLSLGFASVLLGLSRKANTRKTL